MNQSATAIRTLVRPVTRQPLFQRSAQQKCRSCGHHEGVHAALPDPAIAEQLSLIHGGCLNCETCGDE